MIYLTELKPVSSITVVHLHGNDSLEAIFQKWYFKGNFSKLLWIFDAGTWYQYICPQTNDAEYRTIDNLSYIIGTITASALHWGSSGRLIDCKYAILPM